MSSTIQIYHIALMQLSYKWDWSKTLKEVLDNITLFALNICTISELPLICAPGLTHSFFTTGVGEDVTVTMTSASFTASSAFWHATPFISFPSFSAFSYVLLHILT